MSYFIVTSNFIETFRHTISDNPKTKSSKFVSNPNLEQDQYIDQSKDQSKDQNLKKGKILKGIETVGWLK